MEAVLCYFNFKPNAASHVGLTYQLTRHGTDWGSGSTIGSNLYSELTYKDRSSLKKYFLYDGTYEWTSTISLYGSYDLSSFIVPMKAGISLGYIFDWFTGVANNGVKNNSFHYISNSEYKPANGLVMSIDFTIFK